MKDWKNVEVKRQIEPEKGIIIQKGAIGQLMLDGPGGGWPVFQTHDIGTSWDLAIEDKELEIYFKFI